MQKIQEICNPDTSTIILHYTILNFILLTINDFIKYYMQFKHLKFS